MKNIGTEINIMLIMQLNETQYLCLSLWGKLEWDKCINHKTNRQCFDGRFDRCLLAFSNIGSKVLVWQLSKFRPILKNQFMHLFSCDQSILYDYINENYWNIIKPKLNSTKARNDISKFCKVVEEMIKFSFLWKWI